MIFARHGLHALTQMRARAAGAKLAPDVRLSSRGHCLVANGSRIILAKGSSFHAGFLLRTEHGAEIVIGEGVHFGERARLTAGPDARISIGNGCWFSHDVVIDCRQEIVVGEKSLFGPYSYVNDNNHKTDRQSLIIEQGFESAPIRIGSGSWLGVGATLIKGASLGDGVVVAARSVVNKSIPEYEVWGGVPAKRLSKRC